ncbi:restriction endonuclease subunit S [Sphingomicrobium sp. XHP0235]|uniref:restriction endonuclease subunit S n=1 Tax=Sphingomicrobium aquimarinum TaxID=3133971 RepID=UPI0031FF2521
MSNDLPVGWREAQIGDVARIVTGKTPSTKEPRYWGGDIPFVTPSDITDSPWLRHVERHVSNDGMKYSSLVPAGSVLFACIGSIGKSCITHEVSTFNQQINACVPSEQVDAYFLYNALQVRVGDILDLAGTTAVPIINKTTFSKVSISLPPLDEQRRIVEVLRSVDEAIAANEAVAVQSGRAFRAALAQLIGNAPANWETVKLAQIADLTLGKMLDKEKNKGELRPYLANINVRWGAFDMADLRHMRFEERELERYGLRCGDIVMCEGGEPGRCALWIDESSDMMIQKALHRIRPQEGVDSYYLYYALVNGVRSGAYDEYMTGSGIQHLPGNQLAKVEVSLPPFREQQRIAEALRVFEQAAMARLNALKQALQIKSTLMSDLLSGRVLVPE